MWTIETIQIILIIVLAIALMLVVYGTGLDIIKAIEGVRDEIKKLK